MDRMVLGWKDDARREVKASRRKTGGAIQPSGHKLQAPGGSGTGEEAAINTFD